MKKSVKAYLIFLGVTVVLCIAAILYVHNLLVRYEASQPERKVEEQIDILARAARDGTLETVLSFDNYTPESDEVYQSEFKVFSDKLAHSTLSYREANGIDEHLTYYITYGEEALVQVKLANEGTTTKLIVFNFDKWQVVSVEPAVINKTIELPAGIGIKISGNDITGTPNSETGLISYNICSLTTPEIVLSDVAGNESVFDTRRSTTTYNYKLSVPSNYTVSANTLTVDPAIASSENIAEYEYVYEYCPAMPTKLNYDLYFLSNDISFTIKDNLGNDVPFEMENRSVTIEGQASSDAIPESIASAVDVLDIAHQWSLFMTNDLKGGTKGYKTINQYLIEDSYLQGVAYKWATGIDITFTSTHTLANTPFIDNEVSDFVSYGDNCFSVRIKFTKHMILTAGMEIKDKMDSTFYFINISEDPATPDWRIADIRENVNS